MAFFSRKTLQDKGLNAEQIDYIMTESNRRLAADYELKSDVQAKIDAAVNDAHKNASTPNVAESEEYQKLQEEFDTYKRKMEASGELKKGGVKDKFIDAVFGMLDSEKPASEQLAAIREQYEEYFDIDSTSDQTVPSKPQFGGELQGSMPTGDTSGKSLSELWSMPAKKG